MAITCVYSRARADVCGRARAGWRAIIVPAGPAYINRILCGTATFAREHARARINNKRWCVNYKIPTSHITERAPPGSPRACVLFICLGTLCACQDHAHASTRTLADLCRIANLDILRIYLTCTHARCCAADTRTRANVCARWGMRNVLDGGRGGGCACTCFCAPVRVQRVTYFLSSGGRAVVRCKLGGGDACSNVYGPCQKCDGDAAAAADAERVCYSQFFSVFLLWAGPPLLWSLVLLSLHVHATAARILRIGTHTHAFTQ